jgi:hypothetical protein
LIKKCTKNHGKTMLLPALRESWKQTKAGKPLLSVSSAFPHSPHRMARRFAGPVHKGDFGIMRR